MEGCAAGLARLPRVEASARTLARGRGRLTDLLAHEPFLILLVAIEALVLCFRLPNQVRSDTWLSILGGRLVTNDGIPHHDTLTIWAHGHSWIDQQWLGQLAFYGLHALGGFRLLLLVHVLLLLSGFALALVFARRSGGSARSVALVGIGGLLVALPNSAVRTQSVAFLLFVALFWLLASDARRASRRVFLVLPLLVLWANIHGSAMLGAGLVAVWAFAELVRAGRRRAAWPRRARALGAAAGACVCLLVSPYGFSVVDYYDSVLGSAAFRDLVTEWRAATFPAQWPFFVLMVASIWLAARQPRRLSLFEHLALVFTIFAALDAVRNIVWFAILAIMVVPRALDDVWPVEAAPLRRRVNLALSAAAVTVLLVGLLAAAGRSRSWYLTEYPDRAAAVVARAADADSSVRVFANEAFADWLLWKVPSLTGRVAFDARFELMTRPQLRSIVRFRQRSPGLAAARGYGLLVLDPAGERPAIRAILKEPGVAVLFRDSHVIVLRRAPSA
jgi:hypothetical protein